MGGICTNLREEFRLRNFGFHGFQGDRFCHSQWRMPVAVYLGYRLVLMCYAVFWLGYITDSLHRGGGAPQAWGAYLTNWSYTLLNIYLIAHFVAAVVYHASRLCCSGRGSGSRHGSRPGSYCCRCPSSHDHGRMFSELHDNLLVADEYEAIPGTGAEVQVALPVRPPLYLCAVWILFNAISTAAVMVSIVFFSVLYPQFNHPKLGIENIQVHLLNSVIILVEHAFSAVPYRLLHFLYPFLYGLIYMLFSIFYWVGNHKRVMYPILDWNKPGYTLLWVLLIAAMIFVLHSLFFLLYKLKMFFYARLCSRDCS